MSKYGYLKNLHLTEKQQKVLDFIIENKGKDLSPQEIAEHLGYKESNQVTKIIQKFLRLGYLIKHGEGRNVKYRNENN